jgi:hypothetical protein
MGAPTTSALNERNPMSRDFSSRRTGEVAIALSCHLKANVSERQINSLLRRRPELRPPMVAGRRAWRICDVERLRAALAVKSEGVSKA